MKTVWASALVFISRRARKRPSVCGGVQKLTYAPVVCLYKNTVRATALVFILLSRRAKKRPSVCGGVQKLMYAPVVRLYKNTVRASALVFILLSGVERGKGPLSVEVFRNSRMHPVVCLYKNMQQTLPSLVQDNLFKGEQVSRKTVYCTTEMDCLQSFFIMLLCLGLTP